MREITAFAGHAARTVDGKRDPIFDGFTATGLRREYTLSELTAEEKQDVAKHLLFRTGNYSSTQVENIVAAVVVYGLEDALDMLIESVTRP